MKVISTPDPNWHRRVTCNNCESILEVEIQDLTYVADQRDGDCARFACPTCARQGYIPISLIPSHLRSRIK